MKTIDDFEKKYTPDDSIKSVYFDNEGEEGMLEAMGDDLTLVKRIASEQPRRVWTCIDGSNGDMWLINGMAYVNRVYYLVTKEEAKKENEEYLITESEED